MADERVSLCRAAPPCSQHSFDFVQVKMESLRLSLSSLL